MSKRIYPPKEFGQITKKPKFNYVSRPSTSKVSNVFVLSESPNNFWDDEDDDVLVLATQFAEKRQEVVDEVAASELTFSDFGANIKAATSTQQPPKSASGIDHLSQLLDDSDDDAFSNLELPSADIFKKPAPPAPATAPAPTTAQGASSRVEVEKKNTTSKAHPLMGVTDVAVRRQFALEQQVGYLSTRMTKLLAENKKLNQELLSCKDSVISKSGEASLLRDELRHTKQQVQHLKMERIKSREMAQSEAHSKIEQLNRTIETREAQLQMKSAECASLKMRHADETRRWDDSMRHDVSIVQRQEQQQQPQLPTTSAAAAVMEKETEEETQTSMCIKLTSYEDIFEARKNIAFSNALSMYANIYVRTEEIGSRGNPRTMTQIELADLQLLLIQLMYNNDIIPGFDELNMMDKRKNSSEIKYEKIKQQILQGACNMFKGFLSYVQRLEYPKPQRFYPYIEYEFERDIPTSKRSLLQPTELYINERVVNMRRYFAALALACSHSRELAVALLLKRHDNGDLLLKLASSAIEQIGYSSELNDHFGLLEAFAALVHILIIQMPIETMPEDAVQALVELFKQLVFTRPSPWVFCELAAALYGAMMRCKSLLDSGFCFNSPASSFTQLRNRAVHRFTPDSCIMQIYAGIIHTMFPSDREIENQHFSLLIALYYKHVHFLFRCFCFPPKFMKNFVGNYDGEHDFSPVTKTTNMETNNDQAATTTATTTNLTCECYVTLCLSALSLIYQVLYHWDRKNKEFETSEVARVSHLAVQLLHIIFCENYMTSLLTDTDVTKHQYRMVCTWWADNATLLNFGKTQMYFLGKLQESHIMPVLLREGRVVDKKEDMDKFKRLSDGILDEVDVIDENVISDADAVKEVFDNVRNPDKFFECITRYAFNFD